MRENIRKKGFERQSESEKQSAAAECQCANMPVCQCANDCALRARFVV